MRISTYDGFALMSVLFFLHIFSFMSLMSLRSASLAIKTTQHVWRHDKNMTHSHYILSEIERPLFRKCLLVVFYLCHHRH